MGAGLEVGLEGVEGGEDCVGWWDEGGGIDLGGRCGGGRGDV